MIQGSLVAIATPMGDDGEVDYKALTELVEFHVQQGSDGIVAAGTTGESATLGFEEHCKVVSHVVGCAQERLPIIAGTGSNSTKEAIALTQAAKESGAAACLLVTPYYNKPGQQGLYEHYTKVAESVAIPQILYNVPGRTACDLLPPTVAKLSLHKNVVGIKEASGDAIIQRCRELRSRCGDRFAIYSGEDAAAAEVVLQGGQGVISVTANLAPRLMHDTITAALAGDRQQAERRNARLSELHQALFVESNPIPVKWALARMGMMGYHVRLPLTVLAELHHKVLLAAMRKAGINV